uniref:RNA-binding motif protein, X-linked 2 n=1 Tax=Podarcis muralis TaxID=64176 RepID=A0A670JZP9_PODMU
MAERDGVSGLVISSGGATYQGQEEAGLRVRGRAGLCKVFLSGCTQETKRTPMNPLTKVKLINELNEREAQLGVQEKVSWHAEYSDSAWVFVGGLPYELTEGDIICVFSQYGEIVNINLVRDKKTGKSKGFCFICYEDQRSTILAVDNFNGIKIKGRTIRVDHVANYRPPKDSEDIDDVTKALREKGCGAKTPPSSPESSKDSEVVVKKHKKGTFPVDLTKTRLQVQGQSIDARFREIKYRGMFHALFRISKEEGILALYSGPHAAVDPVSFGERCDETLLLNVICGVVSGVISSALANPTDVLKIRMQAQGSLFQGGMIGSFIDIYQQEGTRGLWRGVVPTAQRAAIVVGVELPVYDITKKHLILSGLVGDTILAHFISSFTCGLAGAVASNPVDVVRTRMMNQRAIVGTVDLYRGTLDGLVKTWKSEGFFALYKGFWPNWLRLGPWNIIFFITYEQLKRLPF